jgi:hypothetical protein
MTRFIKAVIRCMDVLDRGPSLLVRDSCGTLGWTGLGCSIISGTFKVVRKWFAIANHFITHLVKSLSISRWVLLSDNAPTQVPSLVKGAVQAKLPRRIFQITSQPMMQFCHTLRSFWLKCNRGRPITFAQCMLPCVTPARIGSPIEGTCCQVGHLNFKEIAVLPRSTDFLVTSNHNLRMFFVGFSRELLGVLDRLDS